MSKEEVIGYTIIADVHCGEQAVVLGYKKNSYCEYVTWRTTRDRRNGYDLGHYFGNFKEAFEDFERRCHDMLDNHLEFQKDRCRARTRNQRER